MDSLISKYNTWLCNTADVAGSVKSVSRVATKPCRKRSVNGTPCETWGTFDDVTALRSHKLTIMLCKCEQGQLRCWGTLFMPGKHNAVDKYRLPGRKSHRRLLDGIVADTAVAAPPRALHVAAVI